MSNIISIKELRNAKEAFKSKEKFELYIDSFRDYIMGKYFHDRIVLTKIDVDVFDGFRKHASKLLVKLGYSYNHVKDLDPKNYTFSVMEKSLLDYNELRKKVYAYLKSKIKDKMELAVDFKLFEDNIYEFDSFEDYLEKREEGIRRAKRIDKKKIHKAHISKKKSKGKIVPFPKVKPKK